MKWYIRFECGVVEKMRKETQSVDNVEILKKLQEKFGWIKDKYYQFYNEVQDERT